MSKDEKEEFESCAESQWIIRVKELMVVHGMSSYQQLATYSGISSGSLNQAMRGYHMPRQTTIEKIARALDVTPQYLLYGDTMKSVVQVPMLRTGDDLFDWVLGSQKANYHMFDVHTRLELNSRSFAWTVNHHDMRPLFQPGDVIVMEPVDDLQHLPKEHIGDAFVLIGKTISAAKNVITGLDAAGIMFGRLLSTNNGLYVEAIDNRMEPVQLTDSDHVLGVAVQQVRQFRKSAD